MKRRVGRAILPPVLACPGFPCSVCLGVTGRVGVGTSVGGNNGEDEVDEKVFRKTLVIARAINFVPPQAQQLWRVHVCRFLCRSGQVSAAARTVVDIASAAAASATEIDVSKSTDAVASWRLPAAALAASMERCAKHSTRG